LDEISTAWENAPLDIFASAAPWLTFRWHRGQKHYSDLLVVDRAGVMSSMSPAWSSRDFCSPTSMLECAGSLHSHSFSAVERRERKHVPDYMLLSQDGPIVVDVKPHAQLAR
jgi:hypothetical protein